MGDSRNIKYVLSKREADISFKLIRTQSEPNLRSNIGLQQSPVSPDNRSPAIYLQADESFIQIVNTVDKLCMSPKNCMKVVKDNVDFGKEDTSAKDLLHLPKTPDSDDSTSLNTPAKIEKNEPITSVTPSPNRLKLRSPAFKTPANRSALKKNHPKNSPGRANAYQHIVSPIASYIKNCPQVPLIQDVRPKKPLPGLSGMPKFVSQPSQDKIQRNKENYNLPSVAYKNAKKTQVVQLPDLDKLPKSRLAKEITSTCTPTVMAHKKREVNPFSKLSSNQDDSFANLSCNQAEVSLCTQKTAFKSIKKH